MESSATVHGEDLENGFSEYKQLILSELKTLREENKETRKSVDALKVDMAMMKVKAGIWGFAGSALPVVAYLLFEMMKKGG